MIYRVATNRSGRNLWWTEDETIPKGHTNIREATAEEAALMDRIVKQDATGDVSILSIGEKIRGLLNPDCQGR